MLSFFPNEKPRICVLAKGRCAEFPWAQAGGSSRFLGMFSQGTCCPWSFTVCGHLAWALGPGCIFQAGDSMPERVPGGWNDCPGGICPSFSCEELRGL